MDALGLGSFRQESIDSSVPFDNTPFHEGWNPDLGRVGLSWEMSKKAKAKDPEGHPNPGQVQSLEWSRHLPEDMKR